MKTNTIPVDAYVVETLMADLVGHDHRASAFVLYLALWCSTRGGADRAEISLRELAERTGLSKRAVQTASSLLVRRKLISVSRHSATAVPVYRLHRPWVKKR